MEETSENVYTEIEAVWGSSYFGSGCYNAGWSVIEGEIEEIKIAGTDDDNGFRRKARYLLRPKTDIAIVALSCGDAISSSGYRRLGVEGKVILQKDPNAPRPKICPDCGHIIP